MVLHEDGLKGGEKRVREIGLSLAACICFFPFGGLAISGIFKGSHSKKTHPNGTGKMQEKNMATTGFTEGRLGPTRSDFLGVGGLSSDPLLKVELLMLTPD